MKNAAKSLILSILARQVNKLRTRNNFVVIAVVGSIGKTSTKLAVARVLSESKRVRYQTGNYNDIVSVPLVFFNQEMPSLLNPIAWAKVLIENNKQLKKPYPYDVVVVELGTDGPGQIAAFKKYIQADIAVVTALTPEHMEHFADMQAVASEELSVGTFSKQLLINNDLCKQELLQNIKVPVLAYGLYKDSTYFMNDYSFSKEGCTFKILKDNKVLLSGTSASFSEPELYSLLAATSVSDLLGIATDTIAAGYTKILPVPGRMQKLNGIKNSTLIDDTYNASPDATKAALQTLYRIEAPQKIVLLGNMNELGKFSAEAHTEIGMLCDPKQLSLLVTLGPDSNKYIGEAAEKNGCRVMRAESPQQAGEFIKENIQQGGLVLLKGSQNRVYAEEAVKVLLLNPSDSTKLVRQSTHWMNIKAKQFTEKDKS